MEENNIPGTNPSGGRPAPDFTLPDVNGNPVTLSGLFDGKRRVMVVFLRHLG